MDYLIAKTIAYTVSIVIVVYTIVLISKAIRRHLDKKEIEIKRSNQRFMAEMRENRKQRVNNYMEKYKQGKEPNLRWNKR